MKPLRVQIQVRQPTQEAWERAKQSFAINWNDEFARSTANQKIREALEKGYRVDLIPISK